MQFTDASHNVLFTLNPEKWNQDLAKSGRAHLVGFQEAEGDPQRRTLAAWAEKNGRGIFHPEGCGNPISWDEEVFAPIEGESGTVEVHRAAGFMKFNPARDIAWVGLRHLESKKRVLRINVHPTAGATDPTPELGARAEDWKDWSIGQYWLDLLAFTAGQMSRGPRQQGKAYWDAILLGGDYNGDLRRKDRWYYPASMLPALFEDDARSPKGLDHLQHTHGSDVRVTRRWKLSGNTDHKIHFIQREFADAEDFPGFPA